MRFMMLMLPAGQCDAAPDAKPSAEAVEKMMRFNKSLQEAGVLLALDGLHPPSAGVRVSAVNGKPKIVDGPFAEAKEVVGGYWMIDVGSRDEAIAWASRCPLGPGDTIEIRQVFEMADFPPDVRKAADGFDDPRQSAT
ncbi:YciI family protein [Dyella nitratireducens]|uniref:Transcription initiation protein n=1 Tax=Dyella nitratireducens TaxID=1849580 RepID=A0ABQ1GPN4_9GAMM|nr:YciI family protein [Dyella nitratireducens]GGA47995.1 transcription initiation protein [Dyella nitratireducens]GLQ42374.1 transcription initiation protein [Dyella nitratireducens]